MEKEKIRKEYNDLVRKLNLRKYSKWYKLKDLVEMKGISYKSLKNMVRRIMEIYEPIGMIRKEGRRYYIHYSILDAFKLKQPRKITLFSHEWKTNISWSTRDYYDKEYHEYLINLLKKLTAEVNYLETIEFDDNKRLHVHLLADKEPETIEPIIENILNYYLDNNSNYRLYCRPINNKGCSVDYLIKNPQ